MTRNDITYTITPRYTYEMSGLNVAENFSDSWLDISHADWKDYLNVMDISTIWGYNPEVENEMLRSTIGDQIYAKGYLVNYSHSGGRFTRNSSATRDDKGNGACEIIFVTEYQILKHGSTVWRGLPAVSVSGFPICIIPANLATKST